MLEQILMHLHNWFAVEVKEGTFTIEGGSIALPFLQTGQYFRIRGSIFNDGLHQHPVNGLMGETFSGTIWALAIPNAVIDLATEMEEWQAKNGDAAAGPYQSESFGGYSYSKATNANGGSVNVFDAYKSRLNPWRKIKGVEP